MTSVRIQHTSRPQHQAVPVLQNGDHLTREEFERRYDAMAECKKAELIEGVVYMGSPVRADQHGAPHAEVIGWLSVYRARTPHVLVADNASVRLDNDNMPQPDVLLMLDRAHGGQSRVDEDGYLEGAPELVVEVAASSVSYDLHEKLNAYRRNGVREYVVWRVLQTEIDWFVLRAGRFERLAPGADGIYRSEVFPGLWLDAAALIQGDLARVHDVLAAGLQSAEHAQFVAKIGGA